MTENVMNNKQIAIALLLVPIFVVVIVFITNAYFGLQIQADPESISEEMLGRAQLVYGLLGIVSLVCALIGGVLFVLATRPPKK